MIINGLKKKKKSPVFFAHIQLIKGVCHTQEKKEKHEYTKQFSWL